MKFSIPLVALVGLASASPVDMTPYKPEPNVDAAFAPFVKEYYRVSEDKTATNDFTDFWPSDGRMILNGKTFKTAGAMLAVKQSLLPPNGNKAWWHLIEGANVVAENATTKTINAKIVIQTTYTPGNCSQAHGNAAFTVAKDAEGLADWTPHSGSLLVYNLTVNTAQSPTDEPCTVV